MALKDLVNSGTFGATHIAVSQAETSLANEYNGASAPLNAAYAAVALAAPSLNITDTTVISLLQSLLAKVVIPTDAQYEALPGGFYAAGSVQLSDVKTVAQMAALAAGVVQWCANQLPVNDL